MPSHTQQLGSLLACPRCDQPLAPAEDGWRCGGCKVEFPELGGVACLLAEPQAGIAAWRERYRLLALKLERDAADLESALAEGELRAATRQRLETLRAAVTDHRSRLDALLAPLALAKLTGTYETYLALRTRLPPEQGIANYYANIHRDWAWGGTENEAAIDLLEQAIGADGCYASTLVLGAGAGRLAYDIVRSGRAGLTVALDHNPMLMMLARRITAGETLELYEFPLAPRRGADEAVLRRLEAEAPAGPDLAFVIGDALRAPFRRGVFDTVVTPWLVDVVDEPFDTLCSRVNALLAPGAQWLNFGSLTFHDPDPALRYDLEECLEIMRSSGFEPAAVEQREIAYMCSPASRHGRRETVVSWRAVKRREAKRAPRPSALPDWIVTGDTPVPLSPAFRSQALATRVHAYIMSLIDGRRSLRDIAAMLERQQLLSAEEAEPTIRSFLIKMHDETRHGRGY